MEETTVTFPGLPETALTRAAVQYARTIEHPAVFNHSIRTFLQAAASARSEECDEFEPETLFLSCVLHDLGTAEVHDGPQRFEVEGADAAASFLQN